MKKLHLNKIFHWLYAFLMFVPIITFLCQFLISFGTGNFDNVSFGFEGFLIDTIGMSFESGVSRQIFMLFDYLFFDVLGISQFTDGFNSLFTYWIMVSVVYLVFDVVMLLINIAHHWIDKGSDSL